MKKILLVFLLSFYQIYSFENNGFLLVANNNLTIGDRVKISGNKIGAKNISINSQSQILSEVYCQNNITITNRSKIDNSVYLGGEIISTNNAQVYGNINKVSYIDFPVYHLYGYTNYSTQNITISANQTLPEGTYDNITITAGSKVALESGGRYKCNSISFGDNSSIAIDGNGEETSLLVLGTPVFGNNFKVNYANKYEPSKFQFSTSTAQNISLGNGVDFRGKFLAPRAKVTLKSKTSLEIMIYANDIVIENDCNLSFTPSEVELVEKGEPILSSPKYSSGILDFAVYATNHVELRDRVNSFYGNIGSSNTITVGNDCVINGSLLATGNINKGHRTEIKGKESGNSRKILHNISTKKIAVGTQNFITNNDDANLHHLPNGSYKDFILKSRSRVKFSSGIYNFSSFKLEPDVEIVFDVKNGPICINVAGKFDIESRHKVSFADGKINPLAVEFYTNYSGVLNIRPDSPFYGVLTAPNSEIHVFSRRDCQGAFYGKNVFIEPDVDISLPPKLHNIWHSQWAYAPIRLEETDPFGFDPSTLFYKAIVPESVTEIDFMAIATDENTTIKIDGVELTDSSRTILLSQKNTTVEIELSLDGNDAKSYYYISFTKENNPYIFVDKNAKGGKNGNSWVNAYTQIKDAIIDAHTSGKEIWVADGKYPVSSDTDSSLIVAPNIELIGGFGGGEEATQEFKDDRTIFNSVITGDVKNDDKEDFKNRQDNVSTVVKLSGREDSKYLIDGFIISGGNGGNGAGLVVENAYLFLKHTLFEDNFASQNGGGIWAENAKIELSSCGLYNNKTDENGGGIFADNSSLSFVNSIIAKNTSLNGGGIFASGSEIDFLNCTISKNSGTGGALNLTNSKSEVLNTIIWDNNDEIFKKSSEIEFSHSNIKGGASKFGEDKGGNKDINPLFINKSNPKGSDGKLGTTDDGFILGSHGYVQHSADFSIAPKYDILKTKRDSTPAMGCYEPYTDSYADVLLGVLDKNGDFTNKIYPNLPIITKVPYQLINKTGRERGRVIQIKIKSTDKIKSTGYVWVCGSESEPKEGLRIPFTKVKTVRGMDYYQSYTSTFGKKILFSTDKSIQGERKPIYVIYTLTDNITILPDKDSFKK